jgi:2-oxoglutarate dehydrogenase E1 component
MAVHYECCVHFVLYTVLQEQRESHLDLLRSDHLAKFLNYKFRNAKVFGLEGCESVILGLQGALRASAELGVEGIEMGMAHRGRMNVLHTFFRKVCQEHEGYEVLFYCDLSL